MRPPLAELLGALRFGRVPLLSTIPKKRREHACALLKLSRKRVNVLD